METFMLLTFSLVMSSDDEFSCSGVVRTVGSSCSDSEKLHTILLDSGADASIFPVNLLGKGHKVHNAIGKVA